METRLFKEFNREFLYRMLITWRARATCIVPHIPTPIHSRVWAAYRANFSQTKPDLLRTRLFPRSSSLVSIPRAEETPTAKIRSYGLQTRARLFPGFIWIASTDRIFWSRENSDRVLDRMPRSRYLRAERSRKWPRARNRRCNYHVSLMQSVVVLRKGYRVLIPRRGIMWQKPTALTATFSLQ